MVKFSTLAVDGFKRSLEDSSLTAMRHLIHFLLCSSSTNSICERHVFTLCVYLAIAVRTGFLLYSAESTNVEGSCIKPSLLLFKPVIKLKGLHACRVIPCQFNYFLKVYQNLAHIVVCQYCTKHIDFFKKLPNLGKTVIASDGHDPNLFTSRYLRNYSEVTAEILQSFIGHTAAQLE